MANIIHIETSTRVCSVAVSVDGQTVFSEVSSEGPSHAVLLGCFVDKALEETGLKGKLDAVAVSCGPGSYTGLRIGVSLAKGLCFGYGVPIIGIPTLKIMATKAIREQEQADALFYPMLDARRMEVYSALYNNVGEEVRETMAEIIEPRFWDKIPGDKPVFLFGDGAEKCRELIDTSRLTIMEGVVPLAEDMSALAEEAFALGKMENAAYFEPYYLKEFQATIAKNKVLDVKKQ